MPKEFSIFVPPETSHLLPADGLGHLALVVPVLALELLDLGGVLLLGLLGRDAVVDQRLPRVVLGLALPCVSAPGGSSPYARVGGLALRSNMPGLAALAMSSPVPIL